MSTRFDYGSHLRSQRLAELKNQAAELERKLSDTRLSMEREFVQSPLDWEDQPGPDDEPPADQSLVDDSQDDECLDNDALRWEPEEDDWDGEEAGRDESASLIMPEQFPAVDPYQPGEASGHYDRVHSVGQAHWPEDRTEVFVNQGRRTTYDAGRSRRRRVLIFAVVLTAIVIALGIMLSGGEASWPASVGVVKSEVTRACLNPDVRSEPAQVNFACDKSTQQILWVFALLTSGNRPDYANGRTGREGLEPISPTQGGEVAWSLNLHHPYNPTNPIDSLQVAARAINNIIGGATLTGANGTPAVQPGLESSRANCVRYTGSPALLSHPGFPSLCAKPIISGAGQAALVADVYQKWMVGAPPQAAQDAAVLFQNANSPGDAQVQAILKRLTSARPRS
ncbi:MAG TPA: hypothetical protein VGS62_04175 [Streptosporangiaceae bacterium]|nr:hypothetical protein [Streptosporangiaceae bacterium]